MSFQCPHIHEVENPPVELQRLYKVRLAEERDQGAIRSLIRRVRINPLNLDWRKFHVAVDGDDQIIGCGQIKRHRDGTNELASVAVVSSWRRRGVGSSIIRSLIGNSDTPLWLVCRSELTSFYEQFGFNEVGQIDDLPVAYRRMRAMARVISRFIPNVGNFAIMMLDSNIKI